MEEHEDTVAFVLIKAKLGQALNVAKHVSGLDGVRWADVVTGPYDVIAAVRVPDNRTLGALVIESIQNVEGVSNPLTAVMSAYYRDGEIQPLGHDGHP